MDRHQVRKAMLKISLLSLVISSWIFTSSIFSTRPEENVRPGALMNLVRLPASIPSQIPGIAPVVRIMDPIAMNVVNVPCWDEANEDAGETSARWIRLTGKSCQENSDAESVSVKNLSNGFSATIFSTAGRASLTTDFIPLLQGQNKILIRFRREKGATVENQLSFVRE